MDKELQEEESICSEEESGSEAAEDEWWAQGGGGGRGRGCFGGDFGDDAATLARATQWRRDNPDLAVRQAEFFHSLWDDPGGAVAKRSCWRSGSRRTTGTSVASATATTCCAAGAHAVGTRRGDRRA